MTEPSKLAEKALGKVDSTLNSIKKQTLLPLLVGFSHTFCTCHKKLYHQLQHAVITGAHHTQRVYTLVPFIYYGVLCL